MAKIARLDLQEFNKITEKLNMTQENKNIAFRVMVNGESVTNICQNMNDRHGKTLTRQRIYEIVRNINKQYEKQFKPWKACPDLLLSESVCHYFHHVQAMYKSNPNGYFHAGMNDALTRLLSGQSCDVMQPKNDNAAEAEQMFIQGYNAIMNLRDDFILG